MSGLNLTAISDNAQRLGQRLQESFSEHTRDLAIARGSSSVYLETSDEKVKNIAKQLDSSIDREKLDAMKRLVAVSDNSIRYKGTHDERISLNSSSRKVGMSPNILLKL
jgi:hypothetical protein